MEWSLTKEEIVNQFVNLMGLWEVKFFELRAKSANVTRKNINNWLDEMELTYANGMVQANILSGYSGYKTVQKIMRLTSDYENYIEAFKNQVFLLSQKDLTQATVLRNGLGALLGDGKWETVYKEYDDFSKANLGLSLRQQQQSFMKTAVFRDHVAFIDRGQRLWSPTAYSEMYCRTRNSEIADEVTWADMDELEMDIVKVSSHGTITPICKQYEGKYFSRNGLTTGLPILDIRPPFHPNCKHRLLPVSPREARSELIQDNNKQNRRIRTFNNKMTGEDRNSIRKQKAWFKENRE